MQNSNGSVTINVRACENSYALQMTGLPTNVWLHIGMSLDSSSQQALGSAISWAGVQIVRIQSLSFVFSVSHPMLSGITLGGSGPVADKLEMVDVRYYTSGLTAADMMTGAGPGTCSIENLGIVRSAAMESCQFYPLVGRDTVLTQIGGTNEYSFPYARVDTSYSATQWMWFTETGGTGWKSIFRLTQTSGDYGTPGDRVMGIFLKKESTSHQLALRFDTPAVVNQGISHLPLPVKAT